VIEVGNMNLLLVSSVHNMAMFIKPLHLIPNKIELLNGKIALKEVMNAMLRNSGLSQNLWDGGRGGIWFMWQFLFLEE
jgi:hypothetical protein